MSKYQLSKAAQLDLSDIADYTIEQFGIRQSRIYKDGLISCFEDLAIKPELGRVYFLDSSKELLRYRFKSHLIFYQETNDGIFIIRVLGGRMDFIRHL